jgi:hypothetical protein
MTFYSIALYCSHLPEVQLFCLSPADISGKSSGHFHRRAFPDKGGFFADIYRVFP